MGWIGGVKIEADNVEDIALVPLYKAGKALSRIVRFAGNTDIPVSVLMHSVHGALYILETYSDELLARFFLLHDACEVVVSDVPRDFKPRSIEEIEEQIIDAMYQKHIGQHPTLEQRKILKHVDVLCGNAECNVFTLEGCPLQSVPYALECFATIIAFEFPVHLDNEGLVKVWAEAVRGDFSRLRLLFT